MRAAALAMLTPSDRALLGEHLRPVAYAPGEVLLQEGVDRRVLLIVRSGLVRVERAVRGRALVLAQLGPGEVLGDIGFVGDAPASASVVAQEPCTVDRIDGDALHALIGAEPGFAARFYHSLARSMADRVRRVDRERIEAAAAGGAHRIGHARTGNLSVRQLPAAVVDGVEAFERAMLDARSRLRAGADPAAEQAGVSRACDAVVGLLAEHGSGLDAVDIGYSDLLAFRDVERIGNGLGDFVFRETFSTFTLSATLSLCIAHPPGSAGHARALDAIDANRAEGDDWLGPLVDRWFLDTPVCRSRRAAVQSAQACIESTLAGAAADGPVRIAVLACGAAREAFAALSRFPGARAAVTGLDADEDALLALGRRAQAPAFHGRLAFQLADVASGSSSPLALPPQRLVCANGVAERLNDERLVGLLDAVHAVLEPGGRFVWTALAERQPDRNLMEHLLDWETVHRSPESIAAAVAASRFAGSALSLTLDGAGVRFVASLVRA